MPAAKKQAYFVSHSCMICTKNDSLWSCCDDTDDVATVIICVGYLRDCVTCNVGYCMRCQLVLTVGVK